MPAPQTPVDGDTLWAEQLGEWLRRLRSGLTAALISARAYWPSELNLKLEAGTGLEWRGDAGSDRPGRGRRPDRRPPAVPLVVD